jgi:dTDP-glucose 4,6-dehydratase
MTVSEIISPRYLITGGAGFIGLAFVKYLISEQPECDVIVLDKLSYASQVNELQNLVDKEKIRFVKGDITNPTTVRNCISGVDYLFNFAAESHVDRSIQNSLPFVHSNTYGVQVLLEAALEAEVRTFIQISTDEVYGTISEGTWTESSPLHPNSPYAASKAAGDLLALAFRKTHGLDVRITRCSNNYGPGQFPEKLIPKVISRIIDGTNIPVYGNGENIREWIHVNDHCRAIFLTLTSGSPGEVYNIGSGIEKTNNEIVADLIRLSNGSYKGEIEYVEDRKGHDQRYSLDFSKISNLGYIPEVSFETGLKETFTWYEALLGAAQNSKNLTEQV